MKRGEFHEVGACFYTRIKWEGGVDLKEGASPQVPISEKQVLQICMYCKAREWIRYDARVNYDEGNYVCGDCTQYRGEVRAYYRELLDSSEYGSDDYDEC